jgi:hypothetical protein
VTIEVRLRESGDATEVILAGVADGCTLAQLAAAVREVATEDRPMILNLDDLTVLDREPFTAPMRPSIPPGGFSAELAVVCGEPLRGVRWKRCAR